MLQNEVLSRNSIWTLENESSVFILRLIREGDLKKIWAVEEKIGYGKLIEKREFREYLSDTENAAIIIETNGEIVALCICEKAKRATLWGPEKIPMLQGRLVFIGITKRGMKFYPVLLSCAFSLTANEISMAWSATIKSAQEEKIKSTFMQLRNDLGIQTIFEELDTGEIEVYSYLENSTITELNKGVYGLLTKFGWRKG
ncbi:TPA: hypothetical protein H1016_00815 [archaeon]|uniref:Uncharacterized protein n=1 Tax=Candidatus Naiadarchaeum limnaeum TaxID=2756139 RepID=A0A832X5R7_9ARCH|nr:hypothetical protein [Candidatus Naiadarchaeum limnaeum]